MLDHLGFDRALLAAGLPQPGSNRAYRPEQLIVQMMLSVWCGSNRFEHVEVTRFDRVLGSFFGIHRMANAKGKTLSLFADDKAIGQWRYSALVTYLNLPALQIWRLYRGRADCENPILELKYDFAAGSLNLRDLSATKARCTP